MEQSYLVRKERCPECAKQGKDQSKDNLGIYSDGHSYCFSCGFNVPVSGVARFLVRHTDAKAQHREHHVYLPEDCDVNYPARALEWVGHYEITKTDLLNHNTLWSEKLQRLIFPVFGDEGLLAYQGRYFGPSAPTGIKPYPKWHGQGDLKNTFNILGKDSKRIILVEDIISAIKLSKITSSMPLYGSFVGPQRFKRLRTILNEGTEVCVWLDPDKRSASILEARRGMLAGLKTRVIYSSADPKEHSYEELEEIICSR